MINQDFSERVYSLLGIKGRGANILFAEQINVSPKLAHDILKGKIPKYDSLLKISKKYGVSIDWLLTGKTFQDIKNIQHNIFIAGKADKSDAIKSSDYAAVPLIEGKIAAGSGRIVDEYIKSWVWLYKPELKGRAYHDIIAVQLDKHADSMKPTINPGDIVIIDRTDKELKRKAIYAIRLEDDACAIKRLDTVKGSIGEHHVIVIVSDNTAHEIELTRKDQEQLIIGRAVWMWRGL